jgi:hypothetical protein
MPTPIEFEIKEQVDSPLRLLVEPMPAGRMMPGSPVTVRNDGGAVIAAFVLRADVEPHGMNKLVIVGPKGLALGQKLLQSMGITRFDESPGKAVLSVDYVLFADGSGWGDDSLGMGKHAAAYLKGRALALERLETLLVGQDDTEIKRSLEVFGSSSFAQPNLIPEGRAPRAMNFEARGYEEVINILRRMPRNTEQGRDLARKLEVMGESRGQ